MIATPTLNSLIISSFGATDLGLVRSKNEDNFLIDDSRGIYSVADGMGGIPYGDIASSTAVQMVRDYFEESVMRGDVFMQEMFERINLAIFKEGHRLNPDLGMGTTLTVAHVSGDRLHIGHVGDSALFLYRNGTVRQLTAEHTMKAVACAGLTPQECENLPEAFGHALTRFLGFTPTIQVDVLEFALQPGDRLMLCSDGITRYLEKEFIEKTFASAVGPENMAKKMVNEAHERGGMDNATAVCFYVKGDLPKVFGLSSPPQASHIKVNEAPKTAYFNRPDVEKNLKSKVKVEAVRTRP